MSVIFSFIASAKRQNLYKGFYDSLVATRSEVPFEIVFVGPNKPSEVIPKFTYVTTHVKPVQCLEIAARHAKGDYLIVSADDVRFSDTCLDRLYNYTLRLDMDRTLISFRYFLNQEPRDFQLCLNVNSASSPFIGQSPLYRKKIWHKLGGLDSRFAGTMSDLDMQMRFYEYGLHPFLTPDCIMNEVVTASDISQGTLYRKSGRSDGQLLASLWMNGGRTSTVARFDDKSIELHSQGSVVSSGKQGKFRWS